MASLENDSQLQLHHFLVRVIVCLVVALSRVKLAKGWKIWGIVAGIFALFLAVTGFGQSIEWIYQKYEQFGPPMSTFLRQKYSDAPILTTTIFALVVGLLMAIPAALAFQKWAKRHPVSSEELPVASKNGPLLEPQLIVDSVQGEQVSYHFEVTNLGSTAAVGIRFLEKTADLEFNELVPPILSQLSPGATMSRPTPILVKLAGAPFSSALTIKYRAQVEGPEFQSDFRFFIPRESLRQQTTYKYMGASHDQSVKDNIPSMNKSALESAFAEFSEQEGGISFVVREKNSQGMPNIINVEAGNNQRRFLLDPANRTVQFETQTKKSRVVRLSIPLEPTKSEAHIIIFTWGATGGALSVDGKEKKDFDL